MTRVLYSNWQWYIIIVYYVVLCGRTKVKIIAFFDCQSARLRLKPNLESKNNKKPESLDFQKRTSLVTILDIPLYLQLSPPLEASATNRLKTWAPFSVYKSLPIFESAIHFHTRNQVFRFPPKILSVFRYLQFTHHHCLRWNCWSGYPLHIRPWRSSYRTWKSKKFI